MAQAGAPAMLSVAALSQRGWTRTLIAKYLGAPDALKRNRRFRRANPKHLYTLERVETAEASASFLDDRRRARTRSEAAKASARTRIERLVKDVEAKDIRVKVIPLQEARTAAIRAYNQRNGKKRRKRKAGEESDPNFLERIIVNFIRHNLTEYDGELATVYTRIGATDARIAIAGKVFEVIATAYPALAAECRRQFARRVEMRDSRNALA